MPVQWSSIFAYSLMITAPQSMDNNRFADIGAVFLHFAAKGQPPRRSGSVFVCSDIRTRRNVSMIVVL